MIGKICIATTFDRNYKQGGKALFNSIRRRTDCDGIAFKIITDDPEVVQEHGAENCHVITDEIKARYGQVKFSKELPREKYLSSWYRYEIFSFEDFDRVICIDSDCICLDDISYLFSEELNQYDLVSVEDHIVSKCFTKYVPALEAQGLNFVTLKQRMADGKIDIQPALLVANRSIINTEWYGRLLHYANTTEFTYSIDEGILNDFIYKEGLRIKLLPLEYDYQDLYEIHCPELSVPSRPVIVHCQESKPFKKDKAAIDARLHKWHDRWWDDYNYVKTIIAIIVWNRFENIERWIRCWNQCDTTKAELVVVHNLEQNNPRYEQLCSANKIRYVPRANRGFDVGAFQDICKQRLAGFPNDWDNLIWVTDDCIPMQPNFVDKYLAKLKEGFIPCYEISDEVKRHIRTTGFLVTKAISLKLTFPRDPVLKREDCYIFEHRGLNLFDQITAMGLKPCMVEPSLPDAPLWDTGCRGFLQLMTKHEQAFPVGAAPKRITHRVSLGLLDDLAIKHKADKSSVFNNLAVKYERLFSGIRQSATSILEIGVAQGQSLKMWADYFPNATIHGADISEASRSCESYCSRIKFHLTDQSNPAQLKNLEQFSPFDFIIDDGNHWWREQILSFEMLFQYIKSGGMYIVEDSCTSYWQEYNNNPISCVEYFKRVIDEVNLMGRRGSIPAQPSPDFDNWDKGWHRREDCHKLPEFESIHFMNSTIVIYRR